jgi:hypothetical protein
MIYGGAYLDGPVGGAGDEDTGVEGVPSHSVHRHVVALIPAQPWTQEYFRQLFVSCTLKNIFFGMARWYMSAATDRALRDCTYICFPSLVKSLFLSLKF